MPGGLVSTPHLQPEPTAPLRGGRKPNTEMKNKDNSHNTSNYTKNIQKTVKMKPNEY